MYPHQRTPRPPRREKTTLSSSSESTIREPVNVFCRLRPLKTDQESACIKLVSPNTLALTTPIDSKSTRKEVHCKFNHIFTSYATQKEVFDHVALPMLEELIKGRNGLLFSYGVTGSGKTHTLTGEADNPGIIPRCIDTLFNSVGEFQAPKFTIKSDKMNGFEVQTESEIMKDKLQEVRSVRSLKQSGSNRRVLGDQANYINDGTKILEVAESNQYAIFVSYIEIYNNTVYDLLDESSGKQLQSKILREDPYKNMYVNGVVEIEVKSAEEAFDMFTMGQKRKRMGHTLLNSESSRSHSIFNLRVVQLEATSPHNHLRVSQLSLVDLAGSERTNRTQNTGMRLKEASSINNSLMNLRNCLEILRENQLCNGNRLVPYRDSRLTFLFKNYFEGEGKVQMIVCVNPTNEDYEENIQVMKFAEMTQDVKIIKSSVDSNRYTPYKSRVKKPLISTPASTTKVKSTTSFNMPKIPTVKFDPENINEFKPALEKLIKALKMRREKNRTTYTEFHDKEKNFRKRLCEMYQENVVNKCEVKSMKAIIKKEKIKNNNLEAKVNDLETVNDSLAGRNEELHTVIKSLRHTIDEKDLKVNQKILEKERLKQKQVLQNEKMTQELDAKLRRQREHLHAAVKAKENKLKKVREVLDADFLDIGIPESDPPEPVHKSTYEPQHTPHATRTPREPLSKRVVQNSAPRPRRSRSAGEVWLEHNAIRPTPLGTIMQPTMKKRKSVSKLSKASDITNPKQSKYCLIAQSRDTEGEEETKVYKGDIVPTNCGGAQVIFNDVEHLKQRSPIGTPKK